MEVGAAGCLGVAVAAGSLVAEVVLLVLVASSLFCPEAGSALGSAYPCSSVSLQLLQWQALGVGVGWGAKEQAGCVSVHNVPQIQSVPTVQTA